MTTYISACKTLIPYDQFLTMDDFNVGKVEYEQQSGWTAAGIILGVMVPLIICMLFIYLKMKKKNQAKNKFWKSPPRSFSFLTKKTSGDGSLFTPDKKKKSVGNKRVYDQSYFTNEPNSPDVDISDRDMSQLSDSQLSSLNEITNGRVKNYPGAAVEDDVSISNFGGSLPNVKANVESSGESDREEDSSDRARSNKTYTLAKSSSRSSVDTDVKAPVSDYSKASSSDTDVKDASPTPYFMNPKRFERGSGSDHSQKSVPKKTRTPVAVAVPKAPPVQRLSSMNSSRRSSSSDRSEAGGDFGTPPQRLTSTSSSGWSSSPSETDRPHGNSVASSLPSNKSESSKGSAIQTAI